MSEVGKRKDELQGTSSELTSSRKRRRLNSLTTDNFSYQESNYATLGSNITSQLQSGDNNSQSAPMDIGEYNESFDGYLNLMLAPIRTYNRYPPIQKNAVLKET